MNINNFEDTQLPEKPLHAIFDRQRELMVKYHDIELASGLMQTEDVPVNIHDARGQARLKDFAWRFMEEIGEAIDAFLNQDLVHGKEELADALHFFVEMCILSDIDADYFLQNGERDMHWLWENTKLMDLDGITGKMEFIVCYLGMACNCLKNKPWKQTQMLTDVEKFKTYMKATFYHFLVMCYKNDIKTVEELYNLYFRKSSVNSFRIDSNY